MSTQRKKKPVEFHFVLMNNPDRYKKLKVARACDFCRRRKSKCDIGIPGSGTCSNCQKHKLVCIFSPVTTRTADLTPRIEDLPFLSTVDQLKVRFPLVSIKQGQVGYETSCYLLKSAINKLIPVTEDFLHDSTVNEPSFQFESNLFQIYFSNIHPAFPVLLQHSILHIHFQDRSLLSRALRFSILTLSSHFYFPSSPSTSYLYSPKENQTNMKYITHLTDSFYRIAKREVNLILDKHSSSPPRLDTIQVLILLYKHHEILGDDSPDAIYYLETAQELIGKLHSVLPQQQEMIRRAQWILFGLISLSNLSDPRFSSLHRKINFPRELPQPLQEEMEEHHTAHQHINQFAQLSNLSLLYLHTIQSLIGGTLQSISFEQFKTARQHWHDSLHPIIQNRFISFSVSDIDDIDVLVLYTAILYDMIYLLLVLDLQQSTELERESIEIAYRLQRIIYTWAPKPSFKSAMQSRRMASFALMICLQIQLSREEDKIDLDFIHQLRLTLSLFNLDPRLDRDLGELINFLTNIKSNNYQAVDYFSLALPSSFMHSTSSSPLDPAANTPGLWEMSSITTKSSMTTPIREKGNTNHFQTAEWVMEQQRQQGDQFQLYLQMQDTANPTHFNTSIPTSTQNVLTEEGSIDENMNPNQDAWSQTTIEHLNQMKI